MLDQSIVCMFSVFMLTILASGIDKHADYAAKLEDNLEVEKLLVQQQYRSNLAATTRSWHGRMSRGFNDFCDTP